MKIYVTYSPVTNLLYRLYEALFVVKRFAFVLILIFVSKFYNYSCV